MNIYSISIRRKLWWKLLAKLKKLITDCRFQSHSSVILALIFFLIQIACDRNEKDKKSELTVTEPEKIEYYDNMICYDGIPYIDDTDYERLKPDISYYCSPECGKLNPIIINYLNCALSLENEKTCDGFYPSYLLNYGILILSKDKAFCNTSCFTHGATILWHNEPSKIENYIKESRNSSKWSECYLGNSRYPCYTVTMQKKGSFYVFISCKNNIIYEIYLYYYDEAKAILYNQCMVEAIDNFYKNREK